MDAVDAAGEPAGPIIVPSPEKPLRSINLSLIKEACFPGEEGAHSAEDVLSVRILRLDGLNIGGIAGLELMSHITELYLQRNAIPRIVNLECCVNLKFLVLSDNQIRVVENLTGLSKLEFLDLSNNEIAAFDDGELPKTLLGLGLAGNPVAMDDEYRVRLLATLPKLELLDLVPVPDYERAMVNRLIGAGGAEDASDEDSDEEEEEEDIEAAFQREVGEFFEEETGDGSAAEIAEAVQRLRYELESAALKGLSAWDLYPQPTGPQASASVAAASSAGGATTVGGAGTTAEESKLDPSESLDPSSYAARRKAIIEKHKAKLDAERVAMRDLTLSSLEASAANLDNAKQRLNAMKELLVSRSHERRVAETAEHEEIQARIRAGRK